ncbi:MAG: hypothetical protein ACJ8F3_01975 [Xanthobacteraceae bacterium]
MSLTGPPPRQKAFSLNGRSHPRSPIKQLRAAIKKIPEKTVVLQWVERQRAWTELPWCDWVRFRGFDQEQPPSLAGVEAGEHFFVVCILGTQDELCNAIPHRYVVSSDARLVHGFDGLDTEEREESDRINQLPFPELEEIARYDELRDRGLSVNLPPLHTVEQLLHSIPGIAGAQADAACWQFLSAIGVCRSSPRAN